MRFVSKGFCGRAFLPVLGVSRRCELKGESAARSTPMAADASRAGFRLPPETSESRVPGRTVVAYYRGGDGGCVSGCDAFQFALGSGSGSGSGSGHCVRDWRAWHVALQKHHYCRRSRPVGRPVGDEACPVAWCQASSCVRTKAGAGRSHQWGATCAAAPNKPCRHSCFLWPGSVEAVHACEQRAASATRLRLLSAELSMRSGGASQKGQGYAAGRRFR